MMGVASYLFFHNRHTLHKWEEYILKRFCFSSKMSYSLSLLLYIFPLCSHLENGLENTAQCIIAISLFSLKVLQGLLNRDSFIQEHRACYFLSFLQPRIVPSDTSSPPRWRTERSTWTEKTPHPSNLLIACFKLQRFTRTAPFTKKSWRRNWTESVSRVLWGESSK